MDAWTATANKVKTVDDFSKKEITGKSAQARFNVLLENHRGSDKKSARASGVSEEYTEAQQLLDELVLVVDEHVRGEAKLALVKKERLAAEENTGKMMRDEAVARLKKRNEHFCGSDNGDNTSSKPSVFDIQREDNTKEHEIRAEHWKQKQEMHHQQKDMDLQDRKEERAFKLQLARLENERYENLLKLTELKARATTNSSSNGCGTGDDGWGHGAGFSFKLSTSTRAGLVVASQSTY